MAAMTLRLGAFDFRLVEISKQCPGSVSERGFQLLI